MFRAWIKLRHLHIPVLENILDEPHDFIVLTVRPDFFASCSMSLLSIIRFRIVVLPSAIIFSFS